MSLWIGTHEDQTVEGSARSVSKYLECPMDVSPILAVVSLSGQNLKVSVKVVVA